MIKFLSLELKYYFLNFFIYPLSFPLSFPVFSHDVICKQPSNNNPFWKCFNEDQFQKKTSKAFVIRTWLNNKILQHAFKDKRKLLNVMQIKTVQFTWNVLKLLNLLRFVIGKLEDFCFHVVHNPLRINKFPEKGFSSMWNPVTSHCSVIYLWVWNADSTWRLLKYFSASFGFRFDKRRKGREEENNFIFNCCESEGSRDLTTWSFLLLQVCKMVDEVFWSFNEFLTHLYFSGLKIKIIIKKDGKLPFWGSASRNQYFAPFHFSFRIYKSKKNSVELKFWFVHVLDFKVS